MARKVGQSSDEEPQMLIRETKKNTTTTTERSVVLSGSASILAIESCVNAIAGRRGLQREEITLNEYPTDGGLQPFGRPVVVSALFLQIFTAM